jgi:hypothetical protein
MHPSAVPCAAFSLRRRTLQLKRPVFVRASELGGHVLQPHQLVEELAVVAAEEVGLGLGVRGTWRGRTTTRRSERAAAVEQAQSDRRDRR